MEVKLDWQPCASRKNQSFSAYVRNYFSSAGGIWKRLFGCYQIFVRLNLTQVVVFAERRLFVVCLLCCRSPSPSVLPSGFMSPATHMSPEDALSVHEPAAAAAELVNHPVLRDVFGTRPCNLIRTRLPQRRAVLPRRPARPLPRWGSVKNTRTRISFRAQSADQTVAL